MEPTRTGSFDDLLYNKLRMQSGIDHVSLMHTTDSSWSNGETEKESIINSVLEYEEKQIADSHDITKSDFGFK